MRVLALLVTGLMSASASLSAHAQGAANPSAGWHFDTRSIAVRVKPGAAVTMQATRVLTPEVSSQIPPDVLDEWGGLQSDSGVPPTGFFQVHKRADRWWLIDPSGHPFIHAAVVALQPGSSERAKAGFAKRFGDMDDWQKQTHQWLYDNGFNGAGAWSDTPAITHDKNLPQTRIVNFLSDYAKSLGRTYVTPGHTGYLGDAMPVFDPAFETFAKEYARRLTSERDNPAIIGWFSDNELPLDDKTLDNFLKLPADDPNGREVRRWLAERQDRPEADISAITQEDRQRWTGHVYATYARIVSQAIRAIDSHHLYLGSRFHGAALNNPYVFAAAGKYLDVISINYYRSWTPDLVLIRNWEAWSGRPVLITEWYVKGEDSGLPNTTGAGRVVPDQAARGAFYQHFVLGLLETRVAVGWHWFKYQDNDPEDPKAEPSNRDANKGLLDIHYAPYLPLVNAARDINLRKYALIRWLDTQTTTQP